MKTIILAGGSGTRLWPLSRQRFPKQFIKFQGKEKSLFQDTFERSVKLSDPKDIYVVTNIDYKFLVMGEVEELGYNYPEENIIVEPEAKNTLPAIYAGVHEAIKTGADTITVFSSDHIIEKSDAFTSIINESEVLSKDYIITFGVKPELPHTGYGYISPDIQKNNGYVVESFKEKPDLRTAEQYVKDGYFWNAGIFMFSSDLFLSECKMYAPEVVDAFDLTDNINDAFNKITNKISVDYGIMEKSDKVAVVPVDIGWNDLGSFDAFYDVLDEDANNNITGNQNIIIESKNNLIQSHDNRVVATVGVEDLIVIDNRDALLICKKDQSQKVKDVVNALKDREDERLIYHVQDYRPWGNYKVLEEEPNKFKIKRIQVTPGKKLSYQLHHHRSEHWIVVSGMAKVTIDDVEQFVPVGESVFFKAGQKHRLENPGKIMLEIIEVQMGSYLEEDDIIRFNDDFGRK